MKTVVGLRVGWGEQTYEVNPNWARLPANLNTWPCHISRGESRRSNLPVPPP